MDKNDAGAETIGQYLFKLTQKVWQETDGFDGKRPFGNSDWDADIYYALIKAQAVEGTIDECGWLTGQNPLEIKILMAEVFDFLIHADPSTFQLPPAPKDHILIALDFDDIVGDTIEDYVAELLTEEDAKKKAETRNVHSEHLQWFAIKAPKPN